jgi:polysaccharide biosynthesis protein PslH
MSGEVLFLCHRVPFPPNRGDKIRSWHILRHVAQIAPVHVCALWDDERDLAHRARLEDICASVTFERANPSRLAAMAKAFLNGKPASVMACASAALQSRVDTLLISRPIQTIYAFSGQMAQFVPIDTNARFVMDFVDMDSAKFAAFGGFANGQEAKRLLQWEHDVAARADLSLFVSDAEADLFRASSPPADAQVTALENGIDLNVFDQARPATPVPAKGHPLIVFTGQMDYRPNVEAVVQFAAETWPIFRAQFRDACFAIVGRNPTAAIQKINGTSGIIVTGEVTDPRDWLVAADIVVAPLLLARGIQNKVLEAMAMAKPVIASPAAAEGIDVEAGRDLIVADGPAATAASLADLMRDPARANAIGEAARARVEARYGWDAQLSSLPEILGYIR